jgi:hypothetical protein
MSIFRVLLILLTASAYSYADSPAREIEPNRWTSVPRIVAFGDVHGAYDELVVALRAASVIDDELNWSGADTHLVSLGDILDRGADSRAVMDLLMKLQTQAVKSHGRVHVVMGNHEAMNLTGDLRYVASGEFKAFADAASDKTRAAAFTDYLEQALAANVADDSPDDPQLIAEAFDARYPHGYFGHRRQFEVDGHYGEWLVRRPLMVILNDNVFVHGGLPPLTAQRPFADINASFTSQIAEIMSLGADLAAAGWIRLDEDLLFQDDTIRTRIETADPTIDPQTLAWAKRFIALVTGPLFGSASPNWYRGTARCHAVLEQPVLAAGLSNLGAQRVVMGHTPTSNRRVQQRFDGRALLADTGMLRSYYHGQPAPIILTGDDLEILYPLQQTSSSSADFIHPLQVNGLPPDDLEKALASTDVTDLITQTESGISNQLQATIDINGKPAHILFEPGTTNANNQKIAAYRLSRLLNLNLVPVTVERTAATTSGVLVALPGKPISESARTAAGLHRSNSCAVGNDYQLMYAFDALMKNEQRNADTIIYDQHNWQLYLLGHSASFTTGSGLPKYLAGTAKILPGSLRAELKALNEAQLQLTLGDQLNKRQIRALLKRRDKLLKDWHDGENP